MKLRTRIEGEDDETGEVERDDVEDIRAEAGREREALREETSSDGRAVGSYAEVRAA